ncbi:MAG: hypothetical protein U9Q34_07355 [Elusimicrobiota bacterium]|nr:hypothetical protein [Elusimicrobiota bacterium]
MKKRAREYKPAENAFALMGLLQSGGEALDDISLLRGDTGLGKIWGVIPAANTLGEWLRRFNCKTVQQLRRIQLATAVKVLRTSKLKRVTLDVDAFFLESQKSDVEMNYEGITGYNPIAVTCSESDLKG